MCYFELQVVNNDTHLTLAIAHLKLQQNNITGGKKESILIRHSKNTLQVKALQ